MRYIILSILTCILIQTSYGQDNEIFETIRNNYYHLKKIQPDLTKKSSNEFGYSTEGAEFTYYTNENNKVLIVECEFFGETGRSKHEYYFKNDSLFFLFILEETYNAPINTLIMSEKELKEMGMEKMDEKKSIFSENRFYFYGNKLIRWLDKDKKLVSKNSNEFLKREREHLEFSREILNKYYMK